MATATTSSVPTGASTVPDQELTIDSSFKFTFPDVAIKDVKLTSTTTFKKFVKIRAALGKLQDPANYDSTEFSTPDINNADVKLMVIKLAPVPGNKGIAPIQVWRGSFKITDPKSPAVKVEGENTAVFWEARFDLGIKPNDNGKFHFYNPNNVDVIVDIFVGFNPKP